MAIFMMAKIVRAHVARGDETVGTGIVKFDEQTRARGAGNVALECRSDPIGKKMGEQAVEGFALRLHGATFGRRDLRPDFGERRDILGLRQAALAELEGANEAAM